MTDIFLDGGREVIEARFIRPSAAIAEFHQKRIALMPPQYYILHTLADILVSEHNKPEEREAVERLALGPFGRLSINPVTLEDKDLSSQGISVLTYEGDEARGGPAGRQHRAHVRFSKRGVSSHVSISQPTKQGHLSDYRRS